MGAYLEVTHVCDVITLTLEQLLAEYIYFTIFLFN